jgi:hypothetical protein
MEEESAMELAARDRASWFAIMNAARHRWKEEQERDRACREDDSARFMNPNRAQHCRVLKVELWGRARGATMPAHPATPWRRTVASWTHNCD